RINSVHQSPIWSSALASEQFMVSKGVFRIPIAYPKKLHYATFKASIITVRKPRGARDVSCDCREAAAQHAGQAFAKRYRLCRQSVRGAGAARICRRPCARRPPREQGEGR